MNRAEDAAILSGSIASFVLTCGTFLLVTSIYSEAAQNSLLEEKHEDAGIACDDCHKESPPARSVPTDVCLSCHGDYDELAEQTREKEPNPHDSHNGALVCEKCHHTHKPSESYCATCHNFGFEVP